MTASQGGLLGKRVVITRPAEQSHALSALLHAQGAEVVAWPLLRIEGLSPAPALAWRDALTQSDWVVFSSVNGVKHAVPHLPTPWPTHIRVAAVGPKTAAALARHGIAVDAMPRSYEARALVAAVQAAQFDLTGKRVLLIQGAATPDVLRADFDAAGALTLRIVVYHSVAVPDVPVPAGPLDALLFASGSAALAAAAYRDRLSAPICVACIGPSTAQRAREAGWSVHVVAAGHTDEGLVDALMRYFAQ
jgi:uroporphyrinogen-III synthase